MLISRFIVQILSLSLLVLGMGVASGQDYPTKPIRMVTNAAGGDGDIASRIIAAGITGSLGQPVLVQNTGGLIPSTVIMLKADPDGYTVLLTGSSLWNYPLLNSSASFNVERDFTPIVQVTKDVYLLVVHPSLPVKSVKELIALAKAKPGELNYSTSVVGGPSHIAPELFNSMAGVNIVRVTYKGTPAALTGVLSGEVQLTYANPDVAAASIKSGRLRVLGVSSAEPTVLAPGVPTILSSLPGYEYGGASGIFAPVKTPAAIINRLNREVVRFLNQPEVKQQFLQKGVEVVGGTPEQFAAMIKAAVTSTAKVIKEAKIEVN